MKRWKLLLLSVLGTICMVVFTVVPLQAHTDQKEEDCTATTLSCPAQAINKLSVELGSFKGPTLKAPEAPAPPAGSRTVTYDVTTRGTITADFATFKTQIHETLNDGRGWSRMGVRFSEVSSGGQFTLVLAAADELPSFSSGCSAEYSCNVGRYVIINQDRWQGATPSWNQAGGSLRDYRHAVVNHETGHWLGHGHENCPGAGQPASIMQQQSIGLQGCVINSWPLESELWSTRLGIT